MSPQAFLIHWASSAREGEITSLWVDVAPAGAGRQADLSAMMSALPGISQWVKAAYVNSIQHWLCKWRKPLFLRRAGSKEERHSRVLPHRRGDERLWQGKVCHHTRNVIWNKVAGQFWVIHTKSDNYNDYYISPPTDANVLFIISALQFSGGFWLSMFLSFFSWKKIKSKVIHSSVLLLYYGVDSPIYLRNHFLFI